MISRKPQTHTIQNISLLLLVFFVLFYVLQQWKDFIFPILVACLFSFAIIGLSNFYRKLRIWWFLSFLLSLGTYGLIFWGIGTLIGSNIEDLILLLPEYQIRVSSLFSELFASFPILKQINVDSIVHRINLQAIFQNVVWWVTSIFSSAGLILFYVLFILLEHRFFKSKLHIMISEHKSSEAIFDIVDKIKNDVTSYFVIKTIVSLITAGSSYIVMKLFWLDFAVFWSLLVFFLNFIPSIWSIIAVSFPALLSLVQFDSYYGVAWMVSLLIGVQILMWNIIEPKFVWNKLNLSPLVIIIALVFWGYIWWVVGMLLSVPIMVIINIILAKIPSTRPIAILLSEKGELQIEGDREVEQTRKRLFEKIRTKLKRK